MARLAFLGSPEAAVPSLRALHEAGHEVALVVSRSDKRRGRGASLSPSPVKQLALDLGLVVTDQLDQVVSSGAELGVVVAYGRIIPGRILEEVPMLNAHFSLLPRWRGAAPVERAILAGDRATGVSVMRLEEGLDTGPVLSMEPVRIDNDGREHASRLTSRLALLASEMLVESLRDGVAALGPGEAQSGEATYAPKVDPDELRLDFSRDVSELERVVRLDRAWTTFRGERMRVLDAMAHAGTGSGGPVGTLNKTAVAATGGSLELLIVQPAGRRPIGAAEWVRGARPVPDEKLGD